MVKKSAGFTLLELLVVMVIIGLLASYVGPKYFQKLSDSEIKATKTQMVALEKALDTYRLDVGRYPSTAEGLGALFKAPNNTAKWKGPYLKKRLPLDPWGNDYVYKYPGEHADFDLLSYGSDGKQGGKDGAADINHWQ